MTNTLTFEQLGETVVVKAENGIVSVHRNGKVTPFRPGFTVEDITKQLEENGWKEVIEKSPVFAAPGVLPSIPKMPETFDGLEKGVLSVVGTHEGVVESAAATNAEAQGVPVDIQKEVDEYLDLHEQMSKLKQKQEKLKQSVRTYMTENSITRIEGTNGRAVAFQNATASNSTSCYTNYRLEDISKLLGSKLLKKVTETRVNSDKLEAMMKLDKEGLGSDTIKRLKAAKISTPDTPRFVVKK